MQITIIGCGNMGSALAKRLSKSSSLFLYDHNPNKADALAKKGFGKSCHDIKEAVTLSNMVLLAVKPYNLKEVAETINRYLKENQTIISILGGTSLKTLKELFTTAPLVRMMPNLPVQCGEGVIGLCSYEQAPKEILTETFKPLGKIYWVPEEKFDGFTSLASSGPAFFFVMLEAMIEAGVNMGFARNDAKEIVHHMLRGSLTLSETSPKNLEQLISDIASPKGITLEGLKILKESGIRNTIIQTFLAAYDKARNP